MRMMGLLLLALSAPGIAQDVHAPVSAVSPGALPAAALPAAAESAASAALALGADGPRMTVPVSIGVTGPYAFVIDTGAQRTVISRQLAGELGLAAGPMLRVTAMSGTSDVGTFVIPSLKVSAIGDARVEAPAFDAVNIGAAGLLGIDTLQAHAVTLDFDAQTMTVTPSRRRRIVERPGSDEIIVQARSLLGQLVVTEAYYGGRRVRVILDTGSAVSMGNDALHRQMIHRGAHSQAITVTSVTGGQLAADYTTIDRISIGTLTIADLPVAFTASDAAPFRQFALENKPAILLGMDALKLFRRVDIDFANRELRLTLPRGVRRG